MDEAREELKKKKGADAKARNKQFAKGTARYKTTVPNKLLQWMWDHQLLEDGFEGMYVKAERAEEGQEDFHALKPTVFDKSDAGIAAIFGSAPRV